MNQKKLINKKIIISAAANGIGWSIAQECMSNGAIVYITEKELAISLSKTSHNESKKSF
jgi:NAD(P)-dependent dehydrogenase (short-subunit alcohol dehydrogenase family)